MLRIWNYLSISPSSRVDLEQRGAVVKLQRGCDFFTVDVPERACSPQATYHCYYPQT